VRYHSKDADTDEKLFSHEDLVTAGRAAGRNAAMEYYLPKIESLKRKMDQDLDQFRREQEQLRRKQEQFCRDKRAEIRLKYINKLLQEIAAARAQAMALAKMTYYERFCRITQQNPFYITAWIMWWIMDITRTIVLTTFVVRFLTDVYSLLIAAVALIAFNAHKKPKQTKEPVMDRVEIPIVTPIVYVDEILDQLDRLESILRELSQTALPDLPNENPFFLTP